jgi:hypothetical protein
MVFAIYKTTKVGAKSIGTLELPQGQLWERRVNAPR